MKHLGRLSHITLLAVVSVAASGCALVGPRSITNGRLDYGEAIAATGDQQTLNMIVAMRYHESFGLLNVASVTANVRMSASAEAQFGIGPDSNFRDNLVPLSTGIAYEENPTISYTPIQGEKYFRQLLTPLPVDVVMLMLDSTTVSAELFLSALDGINGIQNPAFLRGEAEADPRFERVMNLFVELKHAGRLDLVNLPGDYGPTLSLVVLDYAPEYQEKVTELGDLLGLDADPATGQDIVVPVKLTVGRGRGRTLALQTRSVHEWLHIASASIDIAPEHLESGLASPAPELGPVGRLIHIRRSEARPENARVAVRRHGWWYYIDPTDEQSKRYFIRMQALLNLRLAEYTGGRGTPVLTVPVSR
jgi:hypothetical protein